MSNREEFEKYVRESHPLASIYFNCEYDEFSVPGVQRRWEGWQARQPEIDALKAEVARLRTALEKGK